MYKVPALYTQCGTERSQTDGTRSKHFIVFIEDVPTVRIFPDGTVCVSAQDGETRVSV